MSIHAAAALGIYHIQLNLQRKMAIMLPFLVGLLGLGGIVATLVLLGKGMLVWLVLQRVWDFLWKVSIPLLVAGIVLLASSGVLIWKWGIADKGRKAAEAAVVSITKERDKALRDLGSCQANVDNLTGALDAQNAAVDQLKAEGDERQRRVDAALRKARGEADKLRKASQDIQNMDVNGDHCTWALNLHQTIIGKERGR